MLLTLSKRVFVHSLSDRNEFFLHVYCLVNQTHFRLCSTLEHSKPREELRILRKQTYIYKSKSKATETFPGGMWLIDFTCVILTSKSTAKTKKNIVYLATSLPRSNFASVMLTQVPPNVPECLGKPAPKKLENQDPWTIIQ